MCPPGGIRSSTLTLPCTEEKDLEFPVTGPRSQSWKDLVRFSRPVPVFYREENQEEEELTARESVTEPAVEPVSPDFFLLYLSRPCVVLTAYNP